jgi:hypothetical protein
MTTPLNKKFKPFLSYLPPDEYTRVKKFAKKHKITMSQIVREGLAIRMTPDSPYANGINDGIEMAVKVIKGMKASQMRFPSGASFAELVEDELFKHRYQEALNEQT